MARIPNELLNCSIYLYQSVQDAHKGVKSGGSGFLVMVPFSEQLEADRDWYHIYAVTNSRIIKEAQSPIIRLTRRTGKVDVINLEQENWIHHPDGDDMAVTPLDLQIEMGTVFPISSRRFLTPATMERANVGIGSQTVTMGNLINHKGIQQNSPVARFGAIAMEPGEPITHPYRKIQQESFLVETHSISGYTGSPVFVTSGNFKKDATWLLGIVWSRVVNFALVLDEHNRPLEIPAKVETNSGMVGIIPAWKIEELLQVPYLVQHRAEELDYVRVNLQNKQLKS